MVAVRKSVGSNVSSGGIILNEISKENRGTVIAVGPGLRNKSDGKLVPTTISIGDDILFQEDIGTNFTIDNEEITVLLESNIIGVLVKNN